MRSYGRDILNPEEGDQNKSALPRLPSGRLDLGGEQTLFSSLSLSVGAPEVILNICKVFISKEERRKKRRRDNSGRPLRHRENRANHGLGTKGEDATADLSASPASSSFKQPRKPTARREKEARR